MNKILASTETIMSIQYKEAILKKIEKGKKVTKTNLFIVVIVPAINKLIDKYQVKDYIKSVELNIENKYGFNSMYIDILKTEKGNYLTHDIGSGFPDINWMNHIWRPFITEFSILLSKYSYVNYNGHGWRYIRATIK